MSCSRPVSRAPVHHARRRRTGVDEFANLNQGLLTQAMTDGQGWRTNPAERVRRRTRLLAGQRSDRPENRRCRPETLAAGARPAAAGGQNTLQADVNAWLLRFFDFTVVPGKKYSYRVQLIVADPNLAPHVKPAYLDPKVIERIKKLPKGR